MRLIPHLGSHGQQQQYEYVNTPQKPARRLSFSSSRSCCGSQIFRLLLVLMSLACLLERSEPQQSPKVRAAQFKTAEAAAEAHRIQTLQALQAVSGRNSEMDHFGRNRHTHGQVQPLTTFEIGPGIGMDLATANDSLSNTSMRLGMEMKFGDMLVDIDFLIAFNLSNSSIYNCQDRGARCLPDELRFQMKDPSSKLFHVLQHGRFAKLLASSPYAPSSNLGFAHNSYLFERRLPGFALGGKRKLLQAPVPEFEGQVQKSRELILLQVSVLLGSRQIRAATLTTAMSLLGSVRLSAKAALFDLTPRLSRFSSLSLARFLPPSVFVSLSLSLARAHASPSPPSLYSPVPSFARVSLSCAPVSQVLPLPFCL